MHDRLALEQPIDGFQILMQRFKVTVSGSLFSYRCDPQVSLHCGAAISDENLRQRTDIFSTKMTPCRYDSFYPSVFATLIALSQLHYPALLCWIRKESLGRVFYLP